MLGVSARKATRKKPLQSREPFDSHYSPPTYFKEEEFCRFLFITEKSLNLYNYTILNKSQVGWVTSVEEAKGQNLLIYIQ